MGFVRGISYFDLLVFFCIMSLLVFNFLDGDTTFFLVGVAVVLILGAGKLGTLVFRALLGTLLEVPQATELEAFGVRSVGGNCPCQFTLPVGVGHSVNRFLPHCEITFSASFLGILTIAFFTLSISSLDMFFPFERRFFIYCLPNPYFSSANPTT